MWKDTEDDNQLAMLERDVDKESYEEAQMVRQLEEECQELALVDKAAVDEADNVIELVPCLLYTSPSPRDISGSRMPSSA